MASPDDCLWGSQVATFNAVSYFSLGLTACSAVAKLFLKAHFQAKPNHGWKYFWCLSPIKLLLGILLFTVFRPTCSSGCKCPLYPRINVYPTIVMMVGILWALRGKKYYDLDRQGVEGHVDDTADTDPQVIDGHANDTTAVAAVAEPKANLSEII
eukprot:CAMPEP_0119031392 /NCGR_PEP_ID=MMETSP1176-20130426/41519_1 /TAXON_ID=265551 /ORGANISM="Synedropsis recta cf, Strain CCMP1620" /LENGTH=154 /DNA_ID=CAMNT_0006987787 /DNA_START=765 /DNA_END=1229 /DNA_ORIENTATION=-